ncbi:MAG: dihydroorotase [Bacteroidetes bacterium]|nr:dihydroorotase [Bacteroidota bacterium]
MKTKLFKNARLVNEGKIQECDVLVKGARIEKIASSISDADEVIDVQGSFLLPGIIDDQVHFREPGLTHKATIFNESRAAVAGGVTSYIEQPNTRPPALNTRLLEDKFAIAAQRSIANYSFNLGASNDNLEDLLRADYSTFSGIKIFMGSSTGNMLVDDLRVLERIFSEVPHLIITHCEDEATIRANTEIYKARYGDDIPAWAHPLIRSEEACYLSSSSAVELAKKHDTRLHVYHISTAKECLLFNNDLPLEKKRITAEACIHHLWFSDADYEEKGMWIKWNPAIKTADDREGIWQAVIDNRIDVIATDHAPHTKEEKRNPYTSAPSGGPLVQFALQAMKDQVDNGRMNMETLVQKMCHNPAILFRIKDRGYVREGYFADLCILDAKKPYTVKEPGIISLCKWSPFEGHTFSSSVAGTWVNGEQVWDGTQIIEGSNGRRIEFLTF